VKTLFVTGAEGFAGTHLVKRLKRGGYDVVGGVRNRARKLAFERRYGRALVCDVSDSINVARAIASAKPDGIIHLAGTSQPQAAGNEPLIAYQSIVTAWANVLDGVRRVAPRARVLLVSACDVYGNAGADGRSIIENTPLNPISTFGSLKATAESIAQTFFRNYHTNISIARPFHFTGSGQSERFFFSAVAQQVCNWDFAARGDTMQLPDLGCKRDLLHVSDVVTAIEKLIECGRPNETYNICSGRTRTVREIVEQIIRTAGSNLNVASLPGEAESPVPVLCGDNTKLTGEGWQPTATVDHAIEELVESFQPQKAAQAAT